MVAKVWGWVWWQNKVSFFKHIIFDWRQNTDKIKKIVSALKIENHTHKYPLKSLDDLPDR